MYTINEQINMYCGCESKHTPKGSQENDRHGALAWFLSARAIGRKHAKWEKKPKISPQSEDSQEFTGATVLANE